MPRTRRDYLADPRLILHAYNWAVDREEVFRTAWCYDFFTELLFQEKEKGAVAILAHALTTRRFDLILCQYEPFAIAAFMKELCQIYATTMNRLWQRCGPFFSGRYKGTVIRDPASLLRVSRSNDMRPVHERLAKHPSDWRHSSCRTYTGDSMPAVEDPALILALIGGTERYSQFLKECETANPAAADRYLTPGYADIWEGRGRRTRSRIRT